MVENYVIKIVLMVVTTFVISAFLMPYMIKIANHIGAMDIPRTRHIHKKPMPKLGGLGIFIAFLIGYMLFGVQSYQMNAILIGSFFIIITGIVDDIKPLKSTHKLVGQIMAALTVIVYGDILLKSITAFNLTIDFGIFAYPITLFFLLACINIINLIDGLDGLSGGISSIFFMTIGIISFYQQRFGTLEITMTFLMLGATLGFLLYNFNPAKLFAGDSGSMFMGFTIGVISLLGFKGAMLTSMIVPLLILAIPILDTSFAILRRMLRHQPIFQADKDHLHHQFLKMNFSQRTTVLIIYGINILFSLASILYVIKDPELGKILYIILFALVVWFILHTSILSEKMETKVRNFEEKSIKKIHKKTKKS